MRSTRLLVGGLLLMLPLVCAAASDPYLLTLSGSTLDHPPAGYIPITINEDAAVRAAASKTGFWILAPDGTRVHLDYRNKIVHPDGTWTFVGSVSGTFNGPNVLITFGDQAVFGTVPRRSAPSINLTTWHGQTWLVESPTISLQPELRAPSQAIKVIHADMIGAKQSVSTEAQATAENPVTVDLLVVYTSGFLSGVGTTSAAIARIDYLVDVSNQVFQDSQVYARIRLVHTAEVPYPDGDTLAALYDITGESNGSRPPGVPASLASVAPMRSEYGADEVALLEGLPATGPYSESAWPMGQALTPITSADANDAYVVDEDGYDASGHAPKYAFIQLLGSEWGRAQNVEWSFPGTYTFSYAYEGDKPDSTGKMCTLLAIDKNGLDCEFLPYFSNPNIDLCEGSACGVPNQSDAARSLNLTLPTIAAFEPTKLPVQNGRVPNDVDGDGMSDLLFQVPTDRQLNYWLMSGDAPVRETSIGGVGAGYTVAATGDFNADGKVDVVWTSSRDDLYMWTGNGTSFASRRFGDYPSAWKVVGAGDVNGDGKDDLLLYNAAQHLFGYWLMNGTQVLKMQSIGPVGAGYWVAGIGDFNGDGKTDIVWTSANDDLYMWTGNGIGFTSKRFGTYPAGWQVVGTGDVDGDGKSDLLFYNLSTHQFSYRIMNGTMQVRAALIGPVGTGYWVAATGDYNGDGKVDITWTSANDDLYVWTGNGTGFASRYLANYPASWSVVPH